MPESLLLKCSCHPFNLMAVEVVQQEMGNCRIVLPESSEGKRQGGGVLPGSSEGTRQVGVACE